MRKITQESIEAFLAEREFDKQNMSVAVRPWQSEKVNSVILMLHGNPIARYPVGDFQGMMICDGNHQTATTKERLNNLPGVSVNQKAGQWYLNGEKWAGHWTKAARHFEIKQIARGKWDMCYPRGMGKEPVRFGTEAAATAFMHVEASNMGMKFAGQLS